MIIYVMCPDVGNRIITWICFNMADTENVKISANTDPIIIFIPVDVSETSQLVEPEIKLYNEATPSRCLTGASVCFYQSES